MQARLCRWRQARSAGPHPPVTARRRHALVEGASRYTNGHRRDRYGRDRETCRPGACGVHGRSGYRGAEQGPGRGSPSGVPPPVHHPAGACAAAQGLDDQSSSVPVRSSPPRPCMTGPAGSPGWRSISGPYRTWQTHGVQACAHLVRAGPFDHVRVTRAARDRRRWPRAVRHLLLGPSSCPSVFRATACGGAYRAATDRPQSSPSRDTCGGAGRAVMASRRTWVAGRPWACARTRDRPFGQRGHGGEGAGRPAGGRPG
jgi:hypothetical protein